jgi:hypothetical protein
MFLDSELYCLCQVFFLKCPNNTVNRSASTEKKECRRSHYAVFCSELLVFGAIYNIEFSELQFISIFYCKFIVNWLDCLTMGTVWRPELHHNQLLCLQNSLFPVCRVRLFYLFKHDMSPKFLYSL